MQYLVFEYVTKIVYKHYLMVLKYNPSVAT